MIKPMSTAQREALERAMRHTSGGTNKPVGRLTSGFYAPSITTIRIMLANGWIVESQYVRDPAERAEIIDKHSASIKDAREFLNNNDWRSAYSSLSAADHFYGALKRTAYWITDAGKAALL
jgi:hypothetical protein